MSRCVASLISGNGRPRTPTSGSKRPSPSCVRICEWRKCLGGRGEARIANRGCGSCGVGTVRVLSCVRLITSDEQICPGGSTSERIDLRQRVFVAPSVG